MNGEEKKWEQRRTKDGSRGEWRLVGGNKISGFLKSSKTGATKLSGQIKLGYRGGFG